jgi:hypothetical protein
MQTTCEFPSTAVEIDRSPRDGPLKMEFDSGSREQQYQEEEEEGVL